MMMWCSAWTWRLILAGGLLFLMASCGGEDPAPFAQWTMIDVNNTTLQGDSHLLRSGDEVFLVDAGYASVAKDQVLGYLQSKGIDHIDRAFLSHPHADHYEGFSVLLEHGITIDEFYYNLPPSEVRDCCYDEAAFVDEVTQLEAAGVEVHEVHTGDIFFLGETVLEVVHAEIDPLTIVPLDVNDMSLIMKWTVAETQVLFAGDLNTTLGDWLVGNKADELSADIFKVPHHGGRSLAGDTFFASVDATTLLVSGPEWVWCGERGNQARTWAEAQGSDIAVNGLHGHVEVFFDKMGSYDLELERPDSICQDEATYE